jgi:zinc transport system substrate-binding protein
MADTPTVVTDIAPVQSLAAIVLGQTPDVILPPGADPHDFALRPSDGQALAAADLVVQVGPALTPWLSDPIATLAPQARVLVLMDEQGWEPLLIADDDHDHDDDDHDDDGHDDDGHDEGHDHDDDHSRDDDHDADHGDAHDHDEGHEHDEHDHSEAETHDNGDDHAGHDHGPIDPHAWLDPAVVRVWLAAITEAVSELDPENDGVYLTNSTNAAMELMELEKTVKAELSGMSRPIIWPHDAYGYFQRAFDLDFFGSIAPGDGETPGPARLRDLQVLAQQQPVCILSDTSVPESLGQVVGEGADARYASIDLLGHSDQDYFETMMILATTLAECAAP